MKLFTTIATALLLATSVGTLPSQADVREQYQVQNNQEIGQQQECMSMFNKAQFANSNYFGNASTSRKFVDSQGRVYSVTNIDDCKIFEEWRVHNAVVGTTRDMSGWEGTYFIEDDGLIDYQQAGGVIDRVVYPFR